MRSVYANVKRKPVHVIGSDANRNVKTLDYWAVLEMRGVGVGCEVSIRLFSLRVYLRA